MPEESGPRVRGRGRGRGRRTQNPQPQVGGDTKQLDDPPIIPFQAMHLTKDAQINDLDVEVISDEGLGDSLISPTDTSQDESSSGVSVGSSEAPVVSILPEKPPPGTRGRRVVLRNNMLKIRLPHNTPLWKYRVDLHQLRDGKPKRDLTRGASNDYFLTAKRELCYAIYKQVVMVNREFFAHPFAAIYDRRNIFFSLEKLQLPPNGRSFDVQLGDEEYRLTLKDTDDGEGAVDLDDFTGMLTPVLADRKRDLQQAVELITSQIIFYEGNFVSFGTKVYEANVPEEDQVDLGCGRYLVNGFCKSVKFVDADEKEPTCALVTDLKKAAFYKAQPLMKTLFETIKYDSQRRGPFPNRPLKDFEREVLYSNMKGRSDSAGVSVINTVTKREFEIHGVSHKPALETTKTVKDSRQRDRLLSIPQIYEQTHGVTLKWSKLPTLLDKKPGGGYEHHPIEVCEVLPNQRVPMNRQTPEQMQIMIRKAALRPSDAIKEMDQKKKDAHLTSNQFLASIGLQMLFEPMQVEGRVLDAPPILYKKSNQRQGSNVVRVNDQGNWDMKMQQFLESGTCGNWAAVCLDSGPHVSPNTLMAFLDKFQTEARKTGVQMGNLVHTADCTKEGLDTFFKECGRDYAVDFLLCFIPEKKENSLKDRVKYLELKYEILTQCIRTNVAREVADPPRDRSGRQNFAKSSTTLTNILAKTNMKLGGLNYALALNHGDIVGKWLVEEKVLMLGCDVNHPPPQSRSEREKPPREPSVVGFVGNNPQKPLLFSGEIGLQNPREETVRMIESLTTEFLDRWLRHSKKGQLPESVLYFRDGVSDGQFQYVLEQEVEQIRKALVKKGGPGYIPKVTSIVCVKRHNTRLYNTRLNEADNAMRQDCPVGTVVDRGMNHPTMWEFWAKFHQALQGTAKPTRFVVIGDENEFSQDEIDGLCYALCHGHEIVTKSVSLPAPVYGAHEMAERGKRLWRAFNELESSSSGVSSESGESEASAPDRDWDELTAQFRIGGTKFADRKHWA